MVLCQMITPVIAIILLATSEMLYASRFCTLNLGKRNLRKNYTENPNTIIGTIFSPSNIYYTNPLLTKQTISVYTMDAYMNTCSPTGDN
jgi:hypothetical protein